MIKLKKLILLWLPVIIWMIIIFLFSNNPTKPASTIDWLDFFIKKSAHLVEYAIFFVLLFRALTNQFPNLNKNTSFLALILLILYAITDEFHQSFIPGRTATLRDVFIDLAGGIIAYIFLWKLLPKMPPKLKIWANNLLKIY